MIYVRWFTTEARKDPDDYEIYTDGVSKAEFRLGEDGAVKELGVLLEPEMSDAKIWFKKSGVDNGDGYERCFKAGSTAAQAEKTQVASGLEGFMKPILRFNMGLAPFFKRVPT